MQTQKLAFVFIPGKKRSRDDDDDDETISIVSVKTSARVRRRDDLIAMIDKKTGLLTHDDKDQEESPFYADKKVLNCYINILFEKEGEGYCNILYFPLMPEHLAFRIYGSMYLFNKKRDDKKLHYERDLCLKRIGYLLFEKEKTESAKKYCDALKTMVKELETVIINNNGPMVFDNTNAYNNSPALRRLPFKEPWLKKCVHCSIKVTGKVSKFRYE